MQIQEDSLIISKPVQKCFLLAVSEIRGTALSILPVEIYCQACYEGHQACAYLLLLLLQSLADKLSSFSSEELSQIIWSYAQFGHAPSAQLLAAVLAQTQAAVATFQPDSLAVLLAALLDLGCQPNAGLLSAAADVAVANMATFGVSALVDLLQVGDVVHWCTVMVDAVPASALHAK